MPSGIQLLMDSWGFIAFILTTATVMWPLRTDHVQGYTEKYCSLLQELLRYCSAYSLSHKVQAGMTHKKTQLIENGQPMIGNC